MKRISIVLMFSSLNILNIHSQALLPISGVAYGLVNPFIGGDNGGNTSPAAQAPYGMVSWGPNSVSSLDNTGLSVNTAGYVYSSTEINSFSMSRFNGIGCPAMQDLPMMPSTGSINASPVNNRNAYKSAYSHSKESATPGQYSVYLSDYQIQVDLTATERAGLGVFTFPSTSNANFTFAPTNCANGITDGQLVINASGNKISGWVSSGGFCDRNPTVHPYKIYFSAQFNKSFTNSGTWNGNTSTTNQSVSGKNIAAYLRFNCTNDPEVKMKIGLSYVSVANAQLNLDTEISGWDFNTVKTQTADKWKSQLNKVAVIGNATAERTKFYTALYHNCLQPSLFEDVNGQYIGFDDKTHTLASGRHFYVNYSLWDTYRTSASLQAIIAPERTSDMINSMILISQQAVGGGLPIWSLNNTDNAVMNGYSADPFIANAYAFGARDFDLVAMKNVMVQTAMSYHSIKDSNGWTQIDEYKSLGYVPSNFGASVSETIEYGIDDFSIAQICLKAGDSQNYDYFLKRSQGIFNLFNTGSGYLQQKSSAGNWNTPFSSTNEAGFMEGNSTQYTWCIPHDTRKLINLMGGDQTGETRLDNFHSKILVAGWNTTQPYYWLGNEPCFGSPYIYNWIQKPWKSQKLVKDILKNFGSDSKGLPGNDDAGAMSALYIYSAMGLYPAISGLGGFVITGPVFDSVKIDLKDNKKLLIVGKNSSPTNNYIQGLTFNGLSYNKTWITYDSLTQEPLNILNFNMSSQPNTTWGVGTNGTPPSISDINNAPTDIQLSSTDVNEKQPVGTVVGILTSADPDAGNTFTYTLEDGGTNNDKASFTIENNKLKTNAVFVYATKSNYRIKLRTTDQGGLHKEKWFDFIKVLPNITTGFETNKEESHIAIFPNPVVNNTLNIYLDAKTACTIEIFSMQGSKVYEERSTTETQINTSNWEEGIYIIRVTGENRIEHKKIIILK